MRKSVLKEVKDEAKRKKLLDREWYSLRSMLSYWWAIFYFLLGGREAGKSYAVTKFFIQEWRKYGRPFYWMRLSDESARKLLVNNAEKLIDPDLRRKFKLDIVTRGDGVYEVLSRYEDGRVREKRLMARVLSLSTFYNDKGSGLFDKDFLDDPNMYYNICLDEMNREKNERKSFDIVYSFTNQLENLIRSTKVKVRVICIGNTLEEASDILCSFNFLPEEFGRYKLVRNKKLLHELIEELKKPKEERDKDKIKRLSKVDYGKRAVIEYIEPSEKYKTRRQGTIADILSPDASTFTNKIDVDTSLITKKRLTKPSYIIKFTKNIMFTVWDGNIVSEYKGEKTKNVVAMRPYLDELFNTQRRDMVMEMFDTRSYLFRNLITQKKLKKELELLKPRK